MSTLHRIEVPADRVDRLKRSAGRQRFMTCTIAISRCQCERHRGLAGPDIEVLIVPKWPTPACLMLRRRAVLEVPDEDVVALSTAPMRRDQGHELLDAVEALPDDLPLVVVFALAGDEPPRPASSRGCGHRVTRRALFVHRHLEPTQLLAAADVVLHTAARARCRRRGARWRWDCRLSPPASAGSPRSSRRPPACSSHSMPLPKPTALTDDPGRRARPRRP